MKTKILILFIGLMTIAFLCHAGERRMIKQFDKAGLKELNNQLKKQEKLIQKLTKQLQDGGTITSKKPVQTQEDFVSETVLEGASTTVDSIPAVGIARDDGRIELYTNEEENDIISITPTSYVHETQAKIAVPSSYFLDLRGMYVDSDDQRYTADVAVLHDIDGNTITLTNLDETNNVGTAGPIAGGRDQSGAFSASSWIHFFFIYNPVTGDVSSLSSASPTAPTLPTGYTFFVRVGTAYFTSGSVLLLSYQMGDLVTYNIQWVKWDSHADSTNESIDVSAYIPTTAKLIHGTMGLSAGTTARKMRVSANFAGAIWAGALCDAQGTGDVSYGVSGEKNFTLPILASQTLYWSTETSHDIYAVGITGYTDDL